MDFQPRGQRQGPSPSEGADKGQTSWSGPSASQRAQNSKRSSRPDPHSDACRRGARCAGPSAEWDWNRLELLYRKALDQQDHYPNLCLNVPLAGHSGDKEVDP